GAAENSNINRIMAGPSSEEVGGGTAPARVVLSERGWLTSLHRHHRHRPRHRHPPPPPPPPPTPRPPPRPRPTPPPPPPPPRRAARGAAPPAPPATAAPPVATAPVIATSVAAPSTAFTALPVLAPTAPADRVIHGGRRVGGRVPRRGIRRRVGAEKGVVEVH